MLFWFQETIQFFSKYDEHGFRTNDQWTWGRQARIYFGQVSRAIYYEEFNVDIQLFLLARLWIRRERGLRRSRKWIMSRLNDMNTTHIISVFLTSIFIQTPHLIWNWKMQHVKVWKLIPFFFFFLFGFSLWKNYEWL